MAEKASTKLPHQQVLTVQRVALRHKEAGPPKHGLVYYLTAGHLKLDLLAAGLHLPDTTPLQQLPWAGQPDAPSMHRHRPRCALKPHPPCAVPGRMCSALARTWVQGGLRWNPRKGGA